MKLHRLIFVYVFCLPLIFASSATRAWSPLDSLEQGIKAFQGCDWQVVSESEGEKKKIPESAEEEEEEPDCD